MSKKYNAAQTKAILSDVLCGAFEHMYSIQKELTKMAEEKSEDPNIQAQARTLTLTMTLINDIIHPAHKICYQIFKGAEPFIDLCVKNHTLAREQKIVPECHCHLCEKKDN